jgi:antibiotic biosynthesis monooxygenase (ABM) superfamily enzyme
VILNLKPGDIVQTKSNTLSTTHGMFTQLNKISLILKIELLSKKYSTYKMKILCENSMYTVIMQKNMFVQIFKKINL